MTRAAIYARRSKDQNVAEEAKSVTRQVDHARAFAIGRGWAVQDQHVYIDDGISGAEFERRDGLQRMLAHAREFDILIVSEQKSLGRESFETNFTIKQLDEAGVKVVEYVHGRTLTPSGWVDKVTSAVLSAADEGHREQTRERTKESHVDKFNRGHVVGGRVFGYKNVHVYNGVDIHGNPRRSHVDREIDEAEAAVVRRIFELFASGSGLKAIAKQLTIDGAPSPKPFVRQDARYVQPIRGWAPATVRGILSRDLYRGQAVWNKSQKRTAWGKVDQKRRPESEWMTVAVPHLRIVSEDLWKRVEGRRADTAGQMLRFASGRISGRPPKHGARNLLAGLATCATCGGGLVVETSSRKRGRAVEYVCYRHVRSSVNCANGQRIAVETVNEAVLAAIEEHVLTPEAIEQVVRLTERDDLREKHDALEREAKDVAKRIARLVDALETGGDATSITRRLRELEARKVDLAQQQAGLRPLPRLHPAVLEDRLAEWRRLLRQSMPQGRAVLQRVLQGRITFTPQPTGGYLFEAPTRFDKLFSGIAAPVPAYIPIGMQGTEHITAADTFDADYARLLARVQRVGVPDGIRTRVSALKGPRPGPLDDGD